MNPRLVILGSSSGFASVQRASSSYLLDLGNHGILIDCGDGATGNFIGAGYSTEWVDHIFISHTHADHVCGLPFFILQRHLASADHPLTIHCPFEAIATLKDLLRFGYLFPERLPYEIAFDALEPLKRWKQDDVQITPYPTSHLTKIGAYCQTQGLPNRGECFAFHIKVGDVALVYSADLGSLSDLKSIPGEIDLLLFETTHVPLDELWPWLDERSIAKVILTHITDGFDTDIAIEGRKYTSADILIAEDFMTLDLI